MTLICLVGRHGTGKSRIGTAIAGPEWKHISVGLLRRLAVSGQIPSDVPATLMAAFRRSLPGAPLSPDLAAKLLKYVSHHENCVLDGFPSSPDHIDMLPKGAVVVALWTPKYLRTSRLEERGRSTKRAWTNGRPSSREQALASVLWKLRKSKRLIFVPNRLDPPDAVARMARHRVALRLRT